MDKGTLIFLVFTFIVGMFSGFYMYVTFFAPDVKNTVPAQTDDPNSITIDAQMHGACEKSNTCASFNLNNKRAYQYLAAPDAAVKRGYIDQTLSKELFAHIGTANFFDDAKPLSGNVCKVSRSVWFTYTVTLGKTPYTLDSCTSAYSYDTALQKILDDAVWQAITAPKAMDAPRASDSLGAALFSIFWSKDRVYVPYKQF